MKRFTATWTMAVASAVLLTTPATGSTQTPPPTTPPSTSQPATSATTQPEATDSKTAAQEHLRKASAALAEIKIEALPARAKNEIAEVKRRVAALERTTTSTDKASATGQANRSANAKVAANWGTEVAAIDKALTTLLGPDTGTPSAVATSGTTTPRAANKAAAAITLDAEARASLAEVRSHLTAFATAMAGGKTGTEATPSAGSTTDPSSTSTTPATGSTTGQAPTTQPPTTQPPATQAAQPTTPTDPAQPTAPSAQGDQEEARQHLTAARSTLSALTQLPAASQLTGDSRTQVAQLIANFNELITTQSQWRESYGKVNANLTALLGPDPGASDPTNASGNAGAVGTSGTAAGTIDPAVREKLVELRRNLTAFEKAAGGGAAIPSSSAAATSTVDPAASTAATSSTTMTDPAQATGPTGTSTSTQGAAAGNADLMRHVAAIEGLLKMQDESGGLTLTKAQVEQLRTHWAALRTALDKK